MKMGDWTYLQHASIFLGKNNLTSGHDKHIAHHITS